VRVQVVTPDSTFFDGDAASVVLPAWDGEVGILPGHAPLIARLGHGVARVEPSPGAPKVLIAIYGGFVKVQDDLVTVLAGGAAKRPDNPKPEEARKAHEAAKKRLAEVKAKGKAGHHELPDAEEQVRRAHHYLRLLGAEHPHP
jgi:F-type H+-transporting ATPase subunit epsilon